MSSEQFNVLPDELTVRELRYQVRQRGFRAKQITLVTTLLSDDIYSVPERDTHILDLRAEQR